MIDGKKIVQIAVAGKTEDHCLYALTEDGTVYELNQYFKTIGGVYKFICFYWKKVEYIMENELVK